MDPAATTTRIPARSRRRMPTGAREHRPAYHAVPGPSSDRASAGDAAAGPMGRHLAPAEHVDEPRREDAVVAWAGPSVPSVAQLDGWYDTPPTGPVPRAVRLRELVGRDGLDELGELDGTAPDDRDEAPGIRGRVRGLQRAARGLLDEVSEAGATSGELGALVDLASLADTVQAIMVTLTRQVEVGMIAERRAGLPLGEVLALSTRMTGTERRQLLRAAAARDRLPALDAAVHAGLVGAAEARAVLASCRKLDADGRAEINELFIDHDQLATQTVDAVLDEVTRQTVQIADRAADDDHVKAFERRFLAIQPGLGGTLSVYGEIDDQSGALLLRAIDDAAPPITSQRALTRDAALPAGRVPTDRRTLGRRRADGLIALAEHWLASHPDQPGPDGPDAAHGVAAHPKRARPLVYVWTDIATLVGDDASAAAARLLWDTLGPNPVLTPTAVRRLAQDARLQFILASDGEILGVAAPVDTIPAKVRAAVRARDQGCRFPGCSVPISQTDLHHVLGRAQEGHTTIDNLVALCRRHHTAVTDARWILTMTPDGHVKVRRGRHTATSDPPAIRRL